MFKLIDATSVRRTRRFIQTPLPERADRRRADRLPGGSPEDEVYELDAPLPGSSRSVAPDRRRLTLARYRPDDYRLDRARTSGHRRLPGMLRTGLLKRFESSVHAFRLTVEKLIADTRHS